MTASVNKTNLALDDELTLSVQISGTKGNINMPQLPSLPAFNVYSRGYAQSSGTNRDTVSVFTYTMVPRFVGKATIGPVTFNYQGDTYRTEPIEVSIYRRGNTPPAPAASNGTPQPLAEPPAAPARPLTPLETALDEQAQALGTQPFFMVAAVSKSAPYVNEQITLAIRFYYSQSFYDAPYQKPEVSNIFMEDASSSEGTQLIHHTPYRYQEQRYHLIGAAPGPATIGAATVHFRVGTSPLSPFDRLFGGGAVSEERSVSSTPISLKIRPLPGDKPDSFYGAVGKGYSFKSNLQPQEVEAGEAVTWVATVYGTSNLKSTRDLTFPEIDGFRSYPAASSTGKTTGAPVLNYKTFKTVLVPSSSGIYTAPVLEWSYFNPVDGKYHTLKTQPVTIQVTPSTKQADIPAYASSMLPATNGVQTLQNDVRYLKTTAAPAPLWLAKLAAFKAGNIVALTLLVICALFALFGKKSLAQKKAFLTAKARLKKANVHTEIADAVADYLQEKFKINTGSLPLKEVAATLSAKGVRRTTAESFLLLWQRLDAARFAPDQTDAQSTMDLSAQALDVLTLMEEETK